MYVFNSTGHGPFSHLFDDLFIPVVRPNRKWKVCTSENGLGKGREHISHVQGCAVVVGPFLFKFLLVLVVRKFIKCFHESCTELQSMLAAFSGHCVISQPWLYGRKVGYLVHELHSYKKKKDNNGNLSRREEKQQRQLNCSDMVTYRQIVNFVCWSHCHIHSVTEEAQSWINLKFHL